MKLRDAFMCLDCEEIFLPETIEFLDQKVTIDGCPNCTSQAVARLSNWIPTMKDFEQKEKVGA
jgi:hypothetical protein